MSLLVTNESRFDKGYDSDGQIDPFFEALHAERDQLFEESLLMPPTNTLDAADAAEETGAEGDRDNSTVTSDPAVAPEDGLKEKPQQELKIFQSATTTIAWLKTEL